MNYTAKINLKKINKEYLFKSEATGAIYLDIVLLESKDNKYGDSHMIIQSIPKEKRDAGERGEILGNAKPMQQQEQTQSATVEDDDLPF